jgi:hypothetical protein
MFWDLSNDAVGDSESLIEAAADFWLDGRSFEDIAAASGLRFDAVVGGNGQFDLADVLRDPISGGPGLPVQLPPQPVVPLPVAPDSPASTAPVGSADIVVALQLSSQWNGAFEGQLLLTNPGSQALSQWSVSFNSRYELRSLSEFSMQQQRQADGSWQVTLAPPSWGTILQPGTTYRSYVQGVIPGGGQLTSLESALVLAGPGTAPPDQPLSTPTPAPSSLVAPPPVDPITGGAGTIGLPLPAVDVLVRGSDTQLQARGDQAEVFRLGYAWGRQLTIEGFNPTQDRLDLLGFWGEGQQARVLGSAEGVRVELPFNQQAVLLPGVSLDQWGSQVLQIWAG